MKTPAKKYRIELELTESQFNRVSKLATQCAVENTRIFKDAIKLFDFMATKAANGSSFVEVTAAGKSKKLNLFR